MLAVHRLLDAYRTHRWPRRAAVGLCLALALISALGTRAPARAEPSESVVLAARPLAAGARITSADVRLGRYPRRLVPAGALRRLGACIGKRTASPIGPAEVLTVRRLLGPGLTQGLPSGVVAVPVTVAAAGTDDFVHVGDRVDLYRQRPAVDGSPTDRPPVLVIAKVLVLAVLAGTAGPSTDGFDTAPDATNQLVVATYSRDAPKLLLPDSSSMVAVITAPP